MTGPSRAQSNPGAWVATLQWPEVQRRINAGAIGVLPVGAGAKEHGPHLPMNTDQCQAEWFTSRLLERFPLLAWPTANYGYYPAFIDYPGSSHIERGTYSALIGEITTRMLMQRVRHVVILNTGVSTIAVLTELAQRQSALTLINVYSGLRCNEVSNQILESGTGGHADERETSIMLAIDPRNVVTDAMPGRDQTNIGPGPLQWHDPRAANYSPSGIVGDARRASAEKGVKILNAILEDLCAAIEQIHNMTDSSGTN